VGLLGIAATAAEVSTQFREEVGHGDEEDDDVDAVVLHKVEVA